MATSVSPIPLRIGALGAAAITPMALIGPARQVPEVEVLAVAARDPARARAFAARHAIPRVHASYAALLADPEIDLVYNPLPNSHHAEWTIRALQAGKHVLCEKPFAANAAEAERMAAAATATGRVLAEAFAYRFHPLAARIKAIIASGELGALQHVDARFCILNPNAGDIRYNLALAGGAAMDTGCYAVSLIRFLAGAEPEVVSARAQLVAPGVDGRLDAALRFADGRTAALACSMRSWRLFESSVRVRCAAGELFVFNPYHSHFFYWFTVRTRAGARRETVPGARENVYAAQLRGLVRAIRTGAPIPTGPAEGVANMRVIDALYTRAGLAPRGLPAGG